MCRQIILVGLLITAGPVNAQNGSFCQEMWLSRNTILDRAGQCFDTPLGQAVFDNSNCIEGDVRLNPLDQELVRVAQDIERWAQCSVVTSAETLDPGVDLFRSRLSELFTVPVRIDSEHGCRGYLGPEVSLYAGTSTSMTVLGTLEVGQSVSFSHLGLRGGWEYVEVSDTEGAPVAHGWARMLNPDPNLCEFSAG